MPGARDTQDVNKWLDANLHTLDFPATYLGTEPGLREKDGAELQVVLCTPGGYEEAAPNRALSLFNEQINDRLEHVSLDLAFFPNTARELKLFEKAAIPIFSIQRKQPIGKYDVICFSIHQSLQFFVVVKMLAMSGIPVRAADRGEDDPLIIFGGQAMLSPEPIWAVPDVIFIGDGDNALMQMLYAVANRKRNGVTKEDQVSALSHSPGVYIPGWYREHYTKKHVLSRRSRVKGMIAGPMRVEAQRLRDLDGVPIATDPFLRYAEKDSVWSTSTVEVSRGCGHGCRFCQVGWTRRPYRERSLRQVQAVAGEILRNSGSQTFIPYALNVGDYSRRRSLTQWVLSSLTASITQSSQRVEDWAEGDCYVRLVCRGGLTGVTLGVEGFSERLRRVLNKRITRKDLFAACGNAFARQVQNLKLYYITSLPGEGPEDYAEFHEDIRHIMRERERLGARTQVRVQFTQFQAEPHTPMQWAETRPDDRPLYPTIDKLKELGIDFMFGMGAGHTAANMLNILNRGDRRMCEPLIRMATEEGFVYWPGRGKRDRRAVEKFAAFYMEQRNAHPDGVEYVNAEKDEGEVFSWDFIDTGVSKERLLVEWVCCQSEVERMACVDVPCRGSACGACSDSDYEEGHRIRSRRETDPAVEPESVVLKQAQAVQRVRVKFQLDESHRFLPRRVLHRIFRRAMLQDGVPIARRSFGFATDGVALRNWTWGTDYADIFLAAKLEERQDEWVLRRALARATPEFIHLDRFQVMPLKARPVANVIEAIAYHMDVTKFDKGRRKAGFRHLKQMRADGVEMRVFRRRAGFDDPWRNQVNGLDHLLDMFCYGRQLVMVLTPLVSPYDIFAGVFRSKWRYTQRFSARRIDFFVEQNAEQDDFFRGSCDKCGRPRRTNLFDEQAECLRCMFRE